jgi:predicted acylesterase/phospholipase RssA
MNPLKPHSLFFIVQSGIILTLVGCSSIPERMRIPVPHELVEQAKVPGLPQARYWGDQKSPFSDEILKTPKAEIAKKYPELVNRKYTFLSISGGGANGAYGAGLLVGWTARGDRPEFSEVGGISTGAIMAPFAFLGSEYDSVLIDLYTKQATEDVIHERQLLKAIRADAFCDTQPLRKLLLGYLGEKEIQKIAEEYKKGRRLLIGTVNIDAMRPVIWDIGAIASSGIPEARELIVDIIRASAAIPVAMPPVFIDVEANGRIYQEMHVDGGLYSQVMTYPVSMHWDEVAKKLNTQGKTDLYVIRNAKLEPEWEVVKPKISNLAARTISSLIRAQGIGDLYQLYFTSKRDGVDIHISSIPADFSKTSTEPFDKVYMGALFQTGYDAILKGSPWVEKID